jgi:hypothetical protein
MSGPLHVPAIFTPRYPLYRRLRNSLYQSITMHVPHDQVPNPLEHKTKICVARYCHIAIGMAYLCAVSVSSVMVHDTSVWRRCLGLTTNGRVTHLSFPVAPTLEHRVSVKRFVSLQFLNPETVGTNPWIGDQPAARPLPIQTQKNHREMSKLSVGFEPTIPAFELAKTEAKHINTFYLLYVSETVAAAAIFVVPTYHQPLPFCTEMQMWRSFRIMLCLCDMAHVYISSATHSLNTEQPIWGMNIRPWLRLAPSKRPKLSRRLPPNTWGRKHPVSETSCFLVPRIPDDGKSPKTQ